MQKVVSFDGPGFSEEFLENYSPFIEKNSYKITNYSLTDDFIHILMYQIPGTTQKYVNGNGKDSVGEKHSSNSFFSTFGYKRIRYDETGSPVMNEAKNDDRVELFLDFVLYLMNNASHDDKLVIEGLIEDIFHVLFGDKKEEESKKESVFDKLLNNKDALVILAAYFLKYMSEKGLSVSEVIKGVLKFLGLETFPYTTIANYADNFFESPENPIEGNNNIWVALQYLIRYLKSEGKFDSQFGEDGDIISYTRCNRVGAIRLREQTDGCLRS